ncbi:uncharacterized protein LOC121757323 [Salvia splendens]|uniref:uncharacterized protein LOC121757323 n=1 Tax=Salvia splendens TaxID=180675 RepID=UPI001C25778A|nr:uncharacterized protein LOC121757323 [Salvia splendens]
MANGNIKPTHWRGMHLRMKPPTQAETRRPRPLAMAVKWHPPDQPWIKVNTDGAYADATKKGGGGYILAAFSAPLEAQSALEAELLAIIHGTNLAKEFGRPIWVEADAEQVVKLINSTSWGPAHTRRAMTRIGILMRQHTIRTTFIHREGNKAADYLAKLGLDRTIFCRMSAETAPRMLKAIARMDEMGIPNIRVHDEDRE